MKKLAIILILFSTPALAADIISTSTPRSSAEQSMLDIGGHAITCLTNADDTAAIVNLEGKDSGGDWTLITSFKASGNGPSSDTFITERIWADYRITVASVIGSNPSVSCGVE